MRVRSALIAALALAACQVNVEGAPCGQPKATTDCPDGQACGNDLKCSARAAECVAAQAFCNPGVDPPRCRADASAIETCTGADAICGSWTIVKPQGDCASTALVCDASGGTPACLCAMPAAEIAVDVAAPAGTLAATGAAQPPECRFKKLGSALAYARNVWLPAHAPAAATVKVYGAAGANVVFGSATGETYPIDVPASVTLAGAAAPALETIIQGDAASAASVVTVEGTLQGVHVANVSMTGNGIDLICGATGSPTLRDVIVSAPAAHLLAKGVTIAGSCGAVLDHVDVSGASGAALDIAAAAGAPITVGGSKLHLSGTGVQASGGKLAFGPDASSRATEVTDNVGGGVVLGGTTVVDATFTSVLVARNGGTGFHVDAIPTTSKLTMTSCDIHSNGTISPTTYGSAGNQRTAGGMLLTQSSLSTFQLQNNSIYGNGGAGADELAFYSTGTWSLNTGACTVPNRFGCVGTGNAVYATGGSVDARNSIWPIINPPVNTPVLWSPECPGTAPACPP